MCEKGGTLKLHLGFREIIFKLGGHSASYETGAMVMGAPQQTDYFYEVGKGYGLPQLEKF